MNRSAQGFGFNVTGDRPAKVLQIRTSSPADVRGLRENDVILAVNGGSVAHLTSDTVARILR